MEYVTVIKIHRTGQLITLPGETEEEFLARMAQSAANEFCDHGKDVGSSVKTTAFRVNS